MRWETLNAYVDGELDAKDRRAVAETLARDPVLAARVATLTRLKQGVKREVKAAVVPPPRAPMARASLGWACAAALVVLVGTGWLALSSRPPADAARAAFMAWSAAGAPANAMQPAGGLNGFPLDLGAAGFRLVYLSEGDGSAGRLAGYEGRHGCRLAVWSRPSRGQAGLEIAQGDRDLRVARWDSKGRRYVLLSETVPAERFALLAEAAVLLTEPTKTDRLRLALDRATGLSERPCTG
ncbi:anti-sigma factor family protein [Methylorubrum sp. SL192]|uniref:anti-sigma factor family protein n=1 Tax=Methylorubrum sp. SL192 TaxID=2995167 RepID=UPI0022745113|nr:anti-sigma factor [Methylorubrum sp. SL192]MCY1644832.1 anti-sigma factor [Methylorubrum sp. SL192]